jgi:MFS family permease
LCRFDYFGASEDAAGAFLAIAYAGGLWAGPLGGYLSDRVGKVSVMMLMSLIIGPVIYLLNVAPYGWGISIVLLFVGALMYIRMPITEAYIIRQTSERNRSTILGIYYFGSRGWPGMMMPVMGYLIGKFGFQTTFTIIGAAMVAVTLVCSAFLWRSRD